MNLFLPKCKPKITRSFALPNMQAYKGGCHKKLTKISKKSIKKCYDPCLFVRAEILVIFGLHFGKNNDLINSF